MRKLLLILLSVSLAGCGGDKAYRVGVVSRSEVFEGADLAAREANGKGGGIEGVPLRLVRADTSAAGEKARPDSAGMIDKLTADTSMKAVLQQATMGLPEPVLRIYYARGIPVLVVGPALGRTDGRWVFHLMPSAHVEAQLMARQATRLWKPQRISIVHSDDLDGNVLAAELQNEMRGTLAMKSPFQETQDTAVVAALERSISASKPDVLFWVGPSRVLGILLVRLRQHLPELRIMGSDAAESKKVYENPDGLYNGFVFVRAQQSGQDTARLNNFQYRYSMWMGGQATSEALLSYDVTTLMVQALRSGARSRQQIRDYLASLGRARPAFQGLTGPISFDDQGVLQRSLGLAEVREDGVKPVPLQPEQRDSAAVAQQK